MISEGMKSNSTLTSLDLYCEGKKAKRRKKIDKKEKKYRQKEKQERMKMQTVNRIGVEGAAMISEVMKSNSTLTELNLGGEEEKSKEERRQMKKEKKYRQKEKQGRIKYKQLIK